MNEDKYGKAAVSWNRQAAEPSRRIYLTGGSVY
jgi:hypothetical protein